MINNEEYKKIQVFWKRMRSAFRGPIIENFGGMDIYFVNIYGIYFTTLDSKITFLYYDRFFFTKKLKIICDFFINKEIKRRKKLKRKKYGKGYYSPWNNNKKGFELIGNFCSKMVLLPYEYYRNLIPTKD